MIADGRFSSSTRGAASVLLAHFRASPQLARLAAQSARFILPTRVYKSNDYVGPPAVLTKYSTPHRTLDTPRFSCGVSLDEVALIYSSKRVALPYGHMYSPVVVEVAGTPSSWSVKAN